MLFAFPQGNKKYGTQSIGTDETNWVSRFKTILRV